MSNAFNTLDNGKKSTFQKKNYSTFKIHMKIRRTILKRKNVNWPVTDSIPREAFTHGGNALCMEKHEFITRKWNAKLLKEAKIVKN